MAQKLKVPVLVEDQSLILISHIKLFTSAYNCACTTHTHTHVQNNF